MILALTTAPRRFDLAAVTRGAVTLTALTLAVGVAGAPMAPEVAHARLDDTGVPSSPTVAAAREAPADADERWIYPARPNVCGTGDGIVMRSADGSTSYMTGSSRFVRLGEWEAEDPPCESGVVVVELEGPAGARTGIRLAVTSEARASRAGDGQATWLAADAAAERLLSDARRVRGSRVARRLVMAAALADAEVWPGLLELARDRGLGQETRKAAIHWLGWQAAAAVAPALDGMVRDPTEADEIRDAAVFALSQLPDDQAIPLLIRLVRTSENARVRSRALFWLADFDDPRAIALFEEILAGPTG